MPRRIDTAFVEFVPDVRALVETDREIERFFRDTARTAERSAEDIEESFDELQRELRETFMEIARTGEGDLDQLARAAEHVATEMHSDFERSNEKSEDSFAELRRAANRELDRIDHQATAVAAGTSARFKGAGLAASAAFLGIGVAATAGIGAIAGFGLKAAAQLEQTQISFNALLGSAEKGEEMFRSLQKFAALTPFEFPEVANAAKRFFAFNQQVGMTDDQIQDVLTTVGDLASVTGSGADGLNRIFLALSQIAGKGKVSLEELRQIGEAVPGFSAVDAIAKQLGVTSAEAMDMISDGAIDATSGINALLAGMQTFPGAAGAMEKQSQTLLGVFSTFKDTVGQALADSFKPVIPEIKGALTELTPVLGDALRELAPAIGTLLSGLLKLAGPLIKLLAQTFTPLIDALGPAFESLGPALEELTPPLVDLAIALVPVIPLLAELLILIAEVAIPLIKLLAVVIGALEPVINILTDGIAFLADQLAKVDWDQFGRDIAEWGVSVGRWFVKAWNAVKNFFVGIGRFFRALPSNILNFIKSLPQRFVQMLADMFKAALFVVGVGIGLLVASFLKTPELIVGALKALPRLIMGFLNFVWDSIVSSAKLTWRNVIAFFTTVPRLIFNALLALPGFVANIFRTVRDNAVGIVSGMISTIVNFFVGLPGRLGGFIFGIGGGIIDFLKRALNNAIGAINSGIGAIDAALPFVDLPRLPFLAKGGVFTGPAVVGEAGIEAAIPLQDNRAMNALVDAFSRAQGGGGAASNNFTVIVEIDGQQLEGRIVRVVNERDRRTRQRVMARNAR